MSDPLITGPVSEALFLPPADRNLVSKDPPNKFFKPFYDQVLSARSWPIVGKETTSKIFRDMLDSVVLRGVSLLDGLARAQSQLQVLTQPKFEE